ncbi:MAG: endonuclease/exonuclease/phosphatase family protein [Chitinophagaceae bacterium]|nr:endonuclease/exonuclease/phosphatase family protein [Chitinophagaceae bacterium]
MAAFVRTFTKRVFIVSNVLLVICFLLACTNSFLNPQKFWFIAVLGLAFPFLLVLNLAFIIFWLIFRSRWALLSLVALLLSFTNVRALIGFNFSSEFALKKDSNTLRILTWNVQWFDEQTKKDKSQKSRRKEMLSFIDDQNADVLCFQEFLEANQHKKASYSNINDITELGYPYHYWVRDHEISWGLYNAGVAIFSKFPLTDTVRIQYSWQAIRPAAESLISADIIFRGKTLRIFTTHLQSVLLRQDDYRNLEKIKSADDSMVEASRFILNKLKRGYHFRASQAQLVRDKLDESPHPEIICGDFNDVPNSYTYFKIKGDRQDAFIEQGAGLGRTYRYVSPTLRIDYLLADDRFVVTQVKRTVLPYSDHYPVITDLQWR